MNFIHDIELIIKLVKDYKGKFNNSQQLLVAMEENAELIQAISKIQRNENKKTRLNLIEEIVDCVIMIFQIIQIYDIQNEEIHNMIIKKVERAYNNNS